MASSTQNLTLKLLIDTKSQRVLFAEASKDVVDFLFSLLALPIGSVVKLLTKEGMVGSVGSLYKSVANLDPTYLQSDRGKNDLLSPTVPLRTVSNNTLFLPAPTSQTERGYYFRCLGNSYSACRGYYTDSSGAICPQCTQVMSAKLTYVDPKSGKVHQENAKGGEVGFVKGVVTYTVMDDLTVTPMSTISGITLLNKFHIRDVGSLQERTVILGMKEGLGLLKASLRSKTVLTDVFIGKKVVASAT